MGRGAAPASGYPLPGAVKAAVHTIERPVFFAEWKLPEKFTYPHPAPAYQQMLRERGLM